MREERAKRELEARRASLYADLYQRAGMMGVSSVESLCRKMHIIELKIQSFKGGIYGK